LGHEDEDPEEDPEEELDESDEELENVLFLRLFFFFAFFLCHDALSVVVGVKFNIRSLSTFLSSSPSS
jgi:hypothetical protein